MGVKVANNAWGTLSANITSVDATIPLTAGHGARFPALAIGDHAWLTLSTAANAVEIVKVTAIVGDTLTVLRGQDGTAAQAFSAGDSVTLRPTAALFNEKLDADTAATVYATKEYVDERAPADGGLALVDLGNSGSGTVVCAYSAAAEGWTLAATGNFNLAVSGFPTGKLSGALLRVMNLGAFSPTSAGITWMKWDGTTTTTYASAGYTPQAAGPSHIALWSYGDGTVYGKMA